ncbi:hypothetical protein [Deinococcus sp. LM3]|uniref:hypothetical protein n=1 Tax=Deinococcus sp. LM3 TaxID=1938608 RepID=UPI00099401D3|nr:hypothetical protein [Deinococcus sp. LM3]OOV12281.1 hypothetical protein BXU09_18480 [Deinococcus sp. LM3]
MDGELQWRLERWWGVTEFQQGATESGLRRVERAMHGYLALGDEAGAVRVTVSLARMLVTSGQVARATRLYRAVLLNLPAAPNPLPRLTALQGWLDLLVAVGRPTTSGTRWKKPGLCWTPRPPSAPKGT